MEVTDNDAITTRLLRIAQMMYPTIDFRLSLPRRLRPRSEIEDRLLTSTGRSGPGIDFGAFSIGNVKRLLVV